MKFNLLLVLAAISTFALADTIVLKTGQVMEGKVLSKDEKTINLEVEQGTILVAVDKIDKIEEDTPEKIAAREAKEEEERALAEQMKEEGRVKYKGKWVTEEEKKAEEKKIAEAKKKREEERAKARKKAEEEAARKKAEEQKRREEQQRLFQQQQQQRQQYNNGYDDYDDRGARFSNRHGGGRNDYNSNSSRRGGSSYGGSSYGGSSYGGYSPFQSGGLNQTRKNSRR